MSRLTAYRCSVFLLLCQCGHALVLANELFEDRVRPILEQHCVSCHNDSDREGQLSLQTRQAAFADGTIVAGDAANSRLLEVVASSDRATAMPKDAAPLSDEQIAILRRWIDEGAVWPDGVHLAEPVAADYEWWSLKPLHDPSPPALSDTWIRNPIDAFILHKQNELGLTHTRQADRRTLIRRLTFDLLGLPPSPEEVEQFVNDPAADAYEKLVDRLLASPHYGEQWARHWLDVVKYADTCGYDKDKLRPNAWPYRDYVIRALNDDMAYSQFVQQQIAGDVLFPDDPNGVVALGFLATGPWDFIGHVEVPESKIDGQVARSLDRDDVVANVMNTFCSVTVQCARCHHHKFDPITQQQYYGLQAVFAAIDKADRPYDRDPRLFQQRREMTRQLADARRELSTVDQEIRTAAGPQLVEIEARIAELGEKSTVQKDAEFGYHSQIAAAPLTPKWVSVDLGDIHRIAAIVLHPCHDDYAQIGAGFGFPVRFSISISTDGQAWDIVDEKRTTDYPNPGMRAYQVRDLERDARFVRIDVECLAERQDDYIFALAELQAFDGDGTNVALGSVVAAEDTIEAPPRWARTNLTDGKWADVGDPTAAATLAQREEDKVALLAGAETPERTARRSRWQQQVASLDAHLKSLPKPEMVYAAATHFEPQGNFKPTEGTPRTVHVLQRGDVQRPAERAFPGTISLADDQDGRFDEIDSEADRRVRLARWLVSPDNPLVWRSIVNRVWQYHFGQGIVSSPNDFGRMGDRPSHPELLDWLAVRFRDDGQSLKQLHRLIVTSSVYRQSAEDTPENAAIDSGNQFLWRMNRRRLEAEEIRDAILTVSGSLDRTMGGPGYYLFELEKTEHSPHYEYHKFNPQDKRSHRRSVYRFIVRSQPNPWMTTLDCADSSQSTPKRNETLTSLQALSLLNNRFNLLMAQQMADRLLREDSSLDQQVNRAMQLLIQRLPTNDERILLSSYAAEHGLANMCRFLFNLSEFVYVD